MQSLKKEHGWLSLIALQWLQDGNNNIRSIGTIGLQKDSLVLTLDEGVSGTLRGKKFLSGVISADMDKVLFGTKALTVIKRGDKYAVRVWDSEYSARKNFTTVDRYPIAKQWKIEARWVQYKEPKRIEIPSVVPGLIQHGTAPGVAIFMFNGKEFTLEPTIEDGEEDYFFIFGDKTNGKETYGAGKFLYAKQPNNGTITLDFNRSYNPPCAFTDFATCPVPLPKNKLPIKIEAGEKTYKLH